MTKTIPVGKHHAALVDDDDYDDLIQFTWTLIRPGQSQYAMRRWLVDQNYKGEYMHQRITGYARTDHVNCNGLDNRRSNLRPATHAENNRNKGKQKGDHTSQYKGVDWVKRSNRWRSRIRIEGRQIDLGTYKDEIQAAKAYDVAALKYHKEFARLNFPLD